MTAEKLPAFVKFRGQMIPFRSFLNRTYSDLDKPVFLDENKKEMKWKPKPAKKKR